MAMGGVPEEMDPSSVVVAVSPSLEPARAPPDAVARAVLDQLHPLLLPAPPDWTPQTPGWAVLAILAALLLGYGMWRGWCHWYANRYRRRALNELQALRNTLLSAELSQAQRVSVARRLPELVRRLALAHAPRSEIAQLQGAAWSDWLDRSLHDGSRPFTQGEGRCLADWAYLPEGDLPWHDLECLLSLVERWIRHHQIPKAAR